MHLWRRNWCPPTTRSSVMEFRSRQTRDTVGFAPYRLQSDQPCQAHKRSSHGDFEHQKQVCSCLHKSSGIQPSSSCAFFHLRSTIGSTTLCTASAVVNRIPPAIIVLPSRRTVPDQNCLIPPSCQISLIACIVVVLFAL